MDSDGGRQRRRRENDVEQHHNGGWEDQGGSEKPKNETARSPAQWAKEVRQPVVNDRVGKRETKCWSPLQEEVGCLSRAARCGLRLRVRQNWMRVSEGIPTCGA